jgi:hypothetical protein
MAPLKAEETRLREAMGTPAFSAELAKFHELALSLQNDPKLAQIFLAQARRNIRTREVSEFNLQSMNRVPGWNSFLKAIR